MLVLCRQEAASPPATAALFGLGLIGGQVAEALCAGGYARAACLPFAWGAAPERPRELADIMALLEASPGRLDVVWSAGAGGFGMSQAAADRELADFSDVLGLARTLAGRRTPGTVRFHLLSSAGGLFEGPRDATPHTPPAPKRTYGVLNLRQDDPPPRAREGPGTPGRPWPRRRRCTPPRRPTRHKNPSPRRPLRTAYTTVSCQASLS